MVFTSYFSKLLIVLIILFAVFISYSTQAKLGTESGKTDSAVSNATPNATSQKKDGWWPWMCNLLSPYIFGESCGSSTPEDRKWNPDLFKEIDFEKPLGSGKNGKTYKVQRKLTLLKRVPLDKVTDKKMLEIENQLAVKSRFVRGLIWWWEDQTFQYIEMEFVPGNFGTAMFSVKSVAKHNKKFPWEWAKKVIAMATEGIIAINKSNMIHRDIKPMNLLVDVDGIIKISDFGQSERRKHLDTKPRKTMLVLTSEECKEHYAAPEACDLDYGPKFDVYSLGLLLFEMLSDTHYDRSQVKDGSDHNLVHITESEAKSLLELMLAIKPKDRCSIQEVKTKLGMDWDKHVNDPKATKYRTPFTITMQGDGYSSFTGHYDNGDTEHIPKVNPGSKPSEKPYY